MELKIPVRTLDPVREALGALGGRRRRPMGREINVLLDADDGRIERSGGALRLRRYGGRWLLTLKGPPRYEDGVKIRAEHETEVADGAAVERILEGLGYRPRLRYEKDREVWRVGEVEVALDRTPMGPFVELEGDREAILALAVRLGLDPERAVRASYVTLWEAYRRENPGLDLPRDMVFPE